MACCRTLIEAIDNEHFDCIKNASHIKFPRTFFSSVYKNIYDTALALSAQLGKTQLIDKLIPICSKQVIHDALVIAAEQGKYETLQQLIFALNYPLGNYQESPLSAAITNPYATKHKVFP